MADQIYDPRLETLLRESLATEVAKLPLTVEPDQVLARRGARSRSGTRFWHVGHPTAGRRRLSMSLGAVAVMAVAIVALRLSVAPDRVDPAAALPTTPDAWSRVVIDAGSDARVVSSVAVSPRGLLAVVSADDRPARLLASTDGDDWTLVPADQHPPLRACGLDCYFGVDGGGSTGGIIVGTDQGFLIVDSEIWRSDDGFDWQRLAGAAEDPDLAAGRMLAAVAAGPGLVAVGSDNKAWYSTDGSDWTLAEVPPPPLPQFYEQGGYSEPTVEMRGLTVAGDTLFAWGSTTASVLGAEDLIADRAAPILWASSDGRSWTHVLDPESEDFTLLDVVAGGPGGLVAIKDTVDENVGHPRLDGHFSADGHTWERVDVFDPRAPWPSNAAPYGEGGYIAEGMPLALDVTSVAATSAGYIAVGGDGVCHTERSDRTQWCVPEEAAIWTSPDGRSWSRLASDDLFTVPASHNPAGAWATDAVAWGSRFVVGGVYDGKPAIWISDSQPSGGSDGRP